ncbi:hypothetical protein GCM10022243_19320 [Saccharothrix violaceirubra]|uniref:Putative MFS family arabinose efflux permease n=1 Tax=Saccharothrix violaceirubra TaxID=413306 RepID=A0A7W7WVK0_9PSEU|nr:MFS transporter [Saccharothrix violaceirubra]MBB4965161.1 putative MFS family arabinose efflux permease [Saccharothrix violaceirubra]
MREKAVKEGETQAVTRPGDLAMVRALAPVLLASAVSLLPYTVYGTFLVAIAHDTGGGIAAVGGLRGLGGLAALAVGALVAPLLDRLPRMRVAAIGLALIALGSLVGALAEFLALVVFSLVLGAGMAVLSPALGAAAADRFGGGPAAGRAATLVNAAQSATVMLAAPLVVAPALLWGWRGDLLALAVLALALAVWFLRDRTPPPGTDVRLGYLASFRALVDLRPLLLVAFLRNATFMGYLSYLAALYDRYHLSAGQFAAVWTLSGASFFAGNLTAGRLVGRRVRADRLLTGSCVVVALGVTGIFFSPWVWSAAACSAVIAFTSSMAMASVVVLIVDRAPTGLRGAALGVNGAANSVGVFAGAAAGGVGLAVGGFPGMAAVFGTIGAVAVVTSHRFSRKVGISHTSGNHATAAPDL